MSSIQKADGDSISNLHGVRIARISTVPFFVVSQLKHQIESLAASGASVTVVTSSGPELETMQSLPGVTCVPIDIPRSIAPWRDLLALIRLWMYFRRERIDIAHSTTPKAGLLTAIAAFAAGVPVRLHTFTGQPWVGMKGAKRWLAFSSDRLIGLLNTRCYADSLSQREFLIRRRALCAERISVIGDGSLAGVDIRRFDRDLFSEPQRQEVRQTLGIPVGAEVLLFVGRITKDKGVNELLQAFSRLKSEGARAHLVFVGPFDSDSGVSGTIAPQQINAIKDTHLVGYSECPERYMAIADILCLPSYREGFGTVVIEAAALGVPAVGTQIYGLSDAIEDGKTGILVPPQDADALYRGLTGLLTEDSVRKQMGLAAKRRAVEKFAASRVTESMIREYLCLLRGRAKA